MYATLLGDFLFHYFSLSLSLLVAYCRSLLEKYNEIPITVCMILQE
uniref:Uncharacterized protein n=1 Tax=Arundo donax TaxID=35708 RepID=A0A0A9G0U0_ARUDO